MTASEPLLDGGDQSRYDGKPGTNSERARGMSDLSDYGVDAHSRAGYYRGHNPFFEDPQYGILSSPYNIIKTIFMCLSGIVFVRMALIATFLFLSYVLSSLAVIGIPIGGTLPKWRRVMFAYPIRFLARCILFVSGFYWVSGTDQRELGTGKDGAQVNTPNVIVANHVSIFDPFKVLWDTGCCVAGKAELFSVPLAGKMLRALECIPIDRFSSEGKKKAVEDITKRALARDLPPLLIFPEGTTTNGQGLIGFKGGAFVPRAPMQIACLSYDYKHANLFLGWRGMGYYLLWANLQFINYQRVDYLPYYYPSEEEVANPRIYSGNVREVMAKHLNVPATLHCYDDGRLYMQAKRKNVHVPFVVEEVKRLHNMDSKELGSLVETFHILDLNKDGTIHMEEFRQVLFHTEEVLAQHRATLAQKQRNKKHKRCPTLPVPSVLPGSVTGNNTDALKTDPADSGAEDFKAQDTLGVKEDMPGSGPLLVRTLTRQEDELEEDIAVNLFNLFDTDDSGELDFLEFVVAISTLTRRLSGADRLRLLFDATANEDRKTINRKGLFKCLLLSAKAVSVQFEAPETTRALIERLVSHLFEDDKELDFDTLLNRASAVTGKAQEELKFALGSEGFI